MGGTLPFANMSTLRSVEQNDEYAMKMSYPVYIVTYTAGEGDEIRELTVYAMDTDTHTYLCGFCAAPDAAEEMASVSRACTLNENRRTIYETILTQDAMLFPCYADDPPVFADRMGIGSQC